MAQNGLMNTKLLTDTGNGQMLRADAARAWFALVAGCFAATGVRLTLTEGYRNLARQVFFWLKWLARVPGYNVAARPGTSNHGLGIAVDMGNYDRAWSWLLANAHLYGWSWAQGKASGERWHWVYVGGETITAATTTKPLETTPEETRPEVTIAHIKDPSRETVYAIDLADGTSPLQPLSTAEFDSGEANFVKISHPTPKQFDALFIKRGVLAQDGALRPVAFSEATALAEHDLLNWHGFAVNRPHPRPKS